MNGIQVGIVFNLFISRWLLDPHKKFDVGGKFKNTIFLLFKCETKLYIFVHVY
jgi:hypothetical protein